MTESWAEKARKRIGQNIITDPEENLTELRWIPFTTTDTDQRQNSVLDGSQEIKQASFTDDFLQVGCREFLFKFERSKKRKQLCLYAEIS